MRYISQTQLDQWDNAISMIRKRRSEKNPNSREDNPSLTRKNPGTEIGIGLDMPGKLKLMNNAVKSRATEKNVVTSTDNHDFWKTAIPV